MIYIEHKRKKEENILKQYPGAIIADVTSKATDSLIKLSPFYPHGNIPVPYSEGYSATCVEAIWQGLKVFEDHDIDIKSFSNDTMKNIKRTVRKLGKPLGHRKGVYGQELLNYIDARFLIYLPAYKHVLENNVQNIINRLSEASKSKEIILLDYTTNSNIFDTSKPLSHAALIKLYIENKYPDNNLLYEFKANPEPFLKTISPDKPKEKGKKNNPTKKIKKKPVVKESKSNNTNQTSLFK